MQDLKETKAGRAPDDLARFHAEPLGQDSLDAMRAAGVPVAFDPSLQAWVTLEPAPEPAALLLRPWQPDDAPVFQSLLSNRSVWAFLPEAFAGPLSLSDAESLIRLNETRQTDHVSAVIFEGTPVGQVRLDFAQDPTKRVAELSYWLGQAYWGRGLATRAVAVFCADMFAQNPELLQLEARVHPDNTASAKVLMRAGFAFQEKREDADGWYVYARRRAA
ncbi:GNAT family N-acetyltransferase [Roseobacteraceae bacterium S113]